MNKGFFAGTHDDDRPVRPEDVLAKTAAVHTTDQDCTVDPRTNCCRECGVEHGDPCDVCHGRGFHRMVACPESDGAMAVDVAILVRALQEIHATRADLSNPVGQGYPAAFGSVRAIAVAALIRAGVR